MENKTIKNGEIGMLLVFFILSLAAFVGSFDLAKGINIGLATAATFPFITSTIMIIMSIAIKREMKHFSLSFKGSYRDKIKETLNELLPYSVAILSLLVIVYAIILPIIGFNIATFLFLFVSMFFLGKVNWIKSVLISVLCTGLIVIIFHYVFKVILP